MSTSTLRIEVDDTISLRLLEERDAGALFALTDQNRSYLRQWLPWLDSTVDVTDSLAFIHSVRRQHAANEGFSCGIWYHEPLLAADLGAASHERGVGQLNSEPLLAGTIGYHTIDWLRRQVEIGYWLAEAYQGRGIMTRSCKAMVGYAFNTLGLHRVEIHCAVGNTRSCAIPQRLGFHEEGMISQGEWLYDHFVDLLVFAVEAHEWRERWGW